MSSLLVPKSYPASGASAEGIPASLLTNTLASCTPSFKTSQSVQALQGSQTASGTLTFNLGCNPSAGYLKPQATYLKCRITIDQTTGNTAGFAGRCGSAGSIIDTLTVTLGSTPVEVIANYGLVYDQLLTHGTNKSYIEQDCTITEACGITKTAVANVCVFDVVIPLNSGVLNNTDKAIPLFVMNSPVSIHIQLATTQRAIYSTVSEAGGYTVSNAEIMYDTIQFASNDYPNAVNAMLASGKLYEIPFKTFSVTQLTTNASMTQTLGVDAISLDCVFYTEQKADQYGVTLAKHKYCSSDGVTNLKLLLDGKLVTNYNVDSTALTFAEMQKALGVLTDSTVTSVVDVNDYLTEGYLAGFNCRKADESDLIFQGQRCSALTLEVSHANGITAGTVSYIIVCYSAVLLIGANGVVRVVKSQ